MASRNSVSQNNKTKRNPSKRNPSENNNALKDNIFTIYTTGLANWGEVEEENEQFRLIYYFNSILESMLRYSLNNFSRIDIHHYDENFTQAQIDYVQTL